MKLIELTVQNKLELFVYVDIQPEVAELCIYKDHLAMRTTIGIVLLDQDENHVPYKDIENAKTIIGSTSRITDEPLLITKESFKEYLHYKKIYEGTDIPIAFIRLEDKGIIEIFFDKLSIQTIYGLKSFEKLVGSLEKYLFDDDLQKINVYQLRYLREARKLRLKLIKRNGTK